MIQITKSHLAPIILTSRGERHCQELETLYNADPSACHIPGNTVLKSRDGIYNDATVKQQLRNDQHQKCCYCESLFTDTSYGDVEHFRPKAGYQQEWKGPLHKPGYYWLAYDWNNLFFSCQLCNQEFKGNYFPLINDSSARAKSHTDVINQEQPLLLNPAVDNPEDHLTFVKDAIAAVDERGKESIKAFGLDRPDLIKSRLDHLKKLRYARIIGALSFMPPLSSDEQELLEELKLTVEEGKEAVEEAKRVWREAAFDLAEYAGMVRANFPQLPHR